MVIEEFALTKLLEHLVKTVRRTIQMATDVPSRAERELIVRFVRYMDERRVLYLPITVDSEAAAACATSLSTVKDEANSVIAALEHPVAKSIIGGVMDAIRQFNDKWYADAHDRSFRAPPDGASIEEQQAFERRIAPFLDDLALLRSAVRGMVQVVAEHVDERASASAILQENPSGRQSPSQDEEDHSNGEGEQGEIEDPRSKRTFRVRIPSRRVQRGDLKPGTSICVMRDPYQESWPSFGTVTGLREHERGITEAGRKPVAVIVTYEEHTTGTSREAELNEDIIDVLRPPDAPEAVGSSSV